MNHNVMQKTTLLQEDFLTEHLVHIKRTEDLPWESLNKFVDLTTQAKLKEYLRDPLNHTKKQMKRKDLLSNSVSLIYATLRWNY